MERAVTSDELVYVDRRRCVRYRPFVAELADQLAFCERLASTSVGPETMVRVGYQAIHGIVEDFCLPVCPPYGRLEWADILLWAIAAPTPRLPRRFHLPDFVEIQFEFGATGFQVIDPGHPPPVVEAALLQILPDLSLAELRARIAEQCVVPLRRFRKRVEQALRAAGKVRVQVRVLAFKPRPLVKGEARPGDPWSQTVSLPDPVYNERVLTNFTVGWVAGRHVRTIAADTAARAVPAIQEIVKTVAGRGRRPDAVKYARWWALHVFGGKSLEAIAESEPFDPKAPDVTSIIERSLRRLGLDVRTK